MKAAVILFAIFCAPLCVNAAVSVEVYEKDGLTSFDGRPLMVGSELSIVVASDSSGYWGGGLFVAGSDRGLARLSARGRDPNSCDWKGSHYPAAGEGARVISWMNQDIWGFDLYTSEANGLPGPWFVVDYQAIGTGDPNVRVYDYAASFADPNEVIVFSHVPSRDFNNDGVVNSVDFAALASWWQAADCNDPDGCGRVDIDGDGHINVQDLVMFAEYWLWGVPRQSVEPVDPNVIFRLQDVEGLSEITLAVGEQITLYVNMETRGSVVQVFHVEVNISDPNYGSIDNTPYDPNNPPGPGTARILAQPRDAFFDDWGPGQFQAQGIMVAGVSISSAITDGPLASFVYTASKPGDVTLELFDLLGAYGLRMEPIRIHQVDGTVQTMSAESLSIEGSMDAMQPPSPDLSINEMVNLLEEIYRTEDEMQALVSEAQWQNFISDVKKSDPVAQ